MAKVEKEKAPQVALDTSASFVSILTVVAPLANWIIILSPNEFFFPSFLIFLFFVFSDFI